MTKAELTEAVPDPQFLNNWEKVLPKLVILISGMVGAAGTFYSKQVAEDPDTKAVIGTQVDIGGLLTAIAGAGGTVGGLFWQAYNTNKTEKAVTEVKAAATIAVNTAAMSPPIDEHGNISVVHSLRTALGQAVDDNQLGHAAAILTLIQSIKNPQKDGVLPDDPPAAPPIADFAKAGA